MFWLVDIVMDKVVFFIDVGDMSVVDAELYVGRVRGLLDCVDLSDDCHYMVVPVRDGGTRVEVFCRDDEGAEWVRRGSVVFGLLEAVRIRELEFRLDRAERVIEGLRGRRWWRFWL